MCQLNLYIVPKNVNKERVLNLMKDYFYYDKPECVTEENILVEVQDENNVYVSAGMGCNCGTVQGSFQEEDKTKSWQELKQEKMNAERERLLRFKSLLESEDYLEKKNEFRKRLDELSEKRNNANGQEADDLLKEMQKMFQDDIFDVSMRYEKRKTEDGVEIVFNTIDEDLENLERSVCGTTEKDFENLKAFVDEILEDADEVKLFSFWQDGDLPKIESEEYVFQDEFKIEDVIYMKYNELLTIFKR